MALRFEWFVLKAGLRPEQCLVLANECEPGNEDMMSPRREYKGTGTQLLLYLSFTQDLVLNSDWVIIS
jgi:hypothetical protein